MQINNCLWSRHRHLFCTDLFSTEICVQMYLYILHVCTYHGYWVNQISDTCNCTEIDICNWSLRIIQFRGICTFMYVHYLLPKGQRVYKMKSMLFIKCTLTRNEYVYAYILYRIAFSLPHSINKWLKSFPPRNPYQIVYRNMGEHIPVWNIDLTELRRFLYRRYIYTLKEYECTIFFWREISEVILYARILFQLAVLLCLFSLAI